MELKEIRIENGLSQIDASKILNISRRSYQIYEKHESVNEEKYIYLCNKLNNTFLIDEDHGILSLEKIKQITNEIFKDYDIKSCFLFGSYAKGKAKPDSDVDLLIDTTTTGLAFFGLIEKLRINLKKKIDLLDINQVITNKELLSEIMKDGIKIYG